MVWHVIAHVPNPDKFEAAPVHPDDVISPRAEDGALPDLCSSLQVTEPAALSKLSDQGNNTVLRKYVCHTLAL